MVRKLSQIKKIVKQYCDVLKQNNICITQAILYGSYARGTAKAYSDIDLVVISPDLARFKPLKRQEILAQLSMYVDAPIEVLGYTPQELNKARNSIFAQILSKTGKSILN
jgi:hypothetical protein